MPKAIARREAEQKWEYTDRVLGKGHWVVVEVSSLWQGEAMDGAKTAMRTVL
jgi:hypothetical protein